MHKYCPRCGSPIRKANQKFCYHCGYPLYKRNQGQTRVSRLGETKSTNHHSGTLGICILIVLVIVLGVFRVGSQVHHENIEHAHKVAVEKQNARIHKRNEKMDAEADNAVNELYSTEDTISNNISRMHQPITYDRDISAGGLLYYQVHTDSFSVAQSIWSKIYDKGEHGKGHQVFIRGSGDQDPTIATGYSSSPKLTKTHPKDY